MGDSESKAGAGLRAPELTEDQATAVLDAIQRSVDQGTVERVSIPAESIYSAIAFVSVTIADANVHYEDYVDFVEMWREFPDGEHVWRVQLHRTRGAA